MSYLKQLRRFAMQQHTQQTGFYRLKPIIIGDKNTNPPTPPLIPVSKSSWWKGVAEGRYPQPVKIGARCTAWKVAEIHAYIDSLGCK